MATENKGKSGPVYAADSVSGISKLRPNIERRSVSGVAALRPATSQNMQGSGSSTTQSSSSVSSTGSNQNKTAE